MKYNFFAYMARMKLIRRWGLMKSMITENIAEHSAQVAQLAHAMALIKNKKFGGNVDVDRITTIALYHETSEVLTGDLPTPIKYYNSEIKKSYKEIEKTANETLIAMLPEEFREDYREIIDIDPDSYEHMIVKAADKIAAYIKCVEETRIGNKEFTKAKQTLKKEIDAYRKYEEVEWFCATYLDSFSLTLDELD